MQYRQLGQTPFNVSTVSFGSWAIGNDCWGPVDEASARAALNAAVDAGVNFFDTADVYGDGVSERLIGQVCKERSEEIVVATKVGRRLGTTTDEGYRRETLIEHVERCLKNLGVAALDLLQLHCPPPHIYYRPSVFETLDELQQSGKIRYYGVSVEKVEEGLKAMEYPGVRSVQIIYNLFRQRPAELFFRQAERRGVGIVARIPLASGLLTGKYTRASKFADNDHRSFNREGAAFDRGETFAGVPYELGLDAVEALKALVPAGMTLTQVALRWALMDPAVSCVIPGAKNAEQARANAAAADLPALDAATMDAVHALYDERIKPHMHDYW